jgi:uncharacterized protein YggE
MGSEKNWQNRVPARELSWKIVASGGRDIPFHPHAMQWRKRKSSNEASYDGVATPGAGRHLPSTFRKVFVMLSNLRLPFATSCVFLASAAAAISADRVVQVSGSGLVSVPADEVVIKLSLSAVDDDLVRVRTSSDKQVKTILDLAEKHGAKPGDYEVNSLKLELSFNEQLRRQVYEVQRELSVKLGVLANLNPLLADLLKLSDLRIESITFGASNARQHEQESRRRAMTDAKETATHLAELAGLKLGKAQQITSSDGATRPFATSVIPVVGKADPFRLNRGKPSKALSSPVASLDFHPNHRDLFVALQAAGGQAAGAEPPADGTFGLGLIEFSVSVTVDFELVE